MSLTAAHWDVTPPTHTHPVLDLFCFLVTSLLVNDSVVALSSMEFPQGQKKPTLLVSGRTMMARLMSLMENVVSSRAAQPRQHRADLCSDRLLHTAALLLWWKTSTNIDLKCTRPTFSKTQGIQALHAPAVRCKLSIKTSVTDLVFCFGN